MRMRKGKPVTSAILLTAVLLLTGVSGCAEKPVETSMSTVHTTWQETTETTTETTTKPATETTADPVLLREPFVGKWVGLLRAGKSTVFFTLMFNADGTGSQECSGKTQKFRYAEPDTVKKTIRVTSESGSEYTISYYNGENASNKNFTFSGGMVIDCEVPSVDCLRIRATDPSLTGVWVSGSGKKATTLEFRSDNVMKDKRGSVPYTIERTVSGKQVIRLLNGDIGYKIEGNVLTLETNDTDIEKEWKKK